MDKKKRYNQEWKDKISLANKGKISWNKGNFCHKFICPICNTEVDGHDKRQKYCSIKCFSKYNSNRLKGRRFSEETRKKMSLARKGKCWEQIYGDKAEEMRRKQSEALKKIPRTKEWNLKNSMAQSGEKGNNWLGGKSFEPYPIQFNNILKIEIKNIYNYSCVLCKRSQENLDKPLHVHHIDYDKNNLDKNNLITLCHNCHSTTNANREFWKELLTREVDL